MHFAELIDAVRRQDDALVLDIPENWKQGRTAYGGLTAALCLHGARTLAGETRALRSAMISFVGPSTETARVTAARLRQGRNASSVRASLVSGETHATEAVFTFADQRDSAVAYADARLPDASPPPHADAQGGTYPDGAPAFTKNFQIKHARGPFPFMGEAGDGPPEQCAWVRHRAPEARDHPLALIALGDALAPAVTAEMTGFAPVSSMTWMIDFVEDAPETEHGWWLLRSVTDHAAGGFSTQDMTIWNTHGALIAKARQMVAVFG